VPVRLVLPTPSFAVITGVNVLMRPHILWGDELPSWLDIDARGMVVFSLGGLTVRTTDAP